MVKLTILWPTVDSLAEKKTLLVLELKYKKRKNFEQKESLTEMERKIYSKL